MTDTGRALLAAAALSLAAMATLAWRIARTDPGGPERLIGELRLAQWAAVLLAAVAAIPIGLAVARLADTTSNLDAALGAVLVGVAGIVLQREPREGLLLVAAAFVVHALIDIAHRPGWLSADLAPRWFTVGCATYNVCLAALCYWGRRR
jgi:nicotinamide riboside transporter PnuC